MSLHEDIALAIRTEIDRLGGVVPLSPTTIALSVQKKFEVKALEPHLEYASLEHLKQMARHALARRYDPESDDNPVHQQDMFSGLLQDAYLEAVLPGDQPVYTPRESMSDETAERNITHLRKSGIARLQHADALQAWLDQRRAARKGKAA